MSANIRRLLVQAFKPSETLILEPQPKLDLEAICTYHISDALNALAILALCNSVGSREEQSRELI